MKKGGILLKNYLTSPELAEVRVSYKTKNKPHYKITKSQDAFEFLFSLFNLDTIEYQEQFYLLLLNRANLVLGWINLSKGGTTGTVVDGKIIFTLALKTNACSIILCHNHPSGNIVPSEADISLTNKISKSGQLIDIKLIDHLIVSNYGGFYSFADDGML